jgi:hypothetical protein
MTAQHRFRPLGRGAAVGACLLFSGFAALAEMPPLSAEQLAQSPHIFTGTVTELQKRQLPATDCVGQEETTLTLMPEASPGMAAPAPQVIRGWQRQWRCAPPANLPPGASGNWGLETLQKGARVKIFAAPGADGGLWIARPNGLQVLR